MSVPAPAAAPLRRVTPTPLDVTGTGTASGAGRSMSVRRIMGTEVEYGISVPGQAGANPMVTSSQVVNAYGARPELNRGGRARWDYEEESPLRDARGFTYSGAAYDPAEALAEIGVPEALAQIADSLGYAAHTVEGMLAEFDPARLPRTPWIYQPG